MNCAGCREADGGSCEFAIPVRLAGMSESTTSCPVQDINTARWLQRLAVRDMRGQMLVSGGVYDQPALMLDAVEVAMEEMRHVDQ